MSTDRRNLRPVGAHGALTRLAGSGRRESPIDRLRVLWAQVAPTAAAHSTPERLSRAGVLTVICADSGWAQELSAHAVEIHARIVHQAPELAVQKVRFAVGAGGVGGGPRAAAARAKPVKPGPAERDAAAAAVEGVADPELRELLRKAVAAGLALQRNLSRRGSP